MSTKFIAIYHVRNNLYVAATLNNDNELIIREINIHHRATRYTIERKLFKVLQEFQLNENTSIGLLNFNDSKRKDAFEEILFLAKMLIPFNVSHFDTTKMLKRINQYHKYVKRRPINKNKDLTGILRKLTVSSVIPWINQEVILLIDNKSNNTAVMYKKIIIALYYLHLKSRINSYQKH